MKKGADHSDRLDRILEGMWTVIAGALVDFAVDAVTLVALPKSHRSIQRAEGPVRNGEHLMLGRDPGQRVRVEVVQPTDRCTSAAVGSRESGPVGADGDP